MQEQETRLLMLVDDEPAQCRLVSAIASRAGWRTVFARDAETAIAMLGTQDGIMLDAIDAMRAGASDYIIKPVVPERLIAALSMAADKSKKLGELHPLTEKITQPLAFEEIIGSAPAMRTALAIAAKAARSRAPNFIEGEHGVGKEVVADAIQAASPRAKLPYLKVNCGAIASNLLDSVLFGHEKDAFAGAFDRRISIFQQAEGGTVFLDEVDLLPPETQIRLVRLLTQGEISPLGATHSYRIDVRILSASNTSLANKLADGQFREDLYYRLNLVQLTIPPLRERTTDIPALARHFLGRMASQPGLRSLGITDEALTMLRGYDWPGNVRQLQSALFRAAVLCERDALTPEEFPQISAAVGVPGNGGSGGAGANDGIGVTLYENDGNMRPLEEIEADVIRLAIGHYRGRMTEVARRLGIGRSTLYRKLADLGISDAA
ncbi:MAG: sigma-54 dependent transcriptional regulator [Sphingorhabdus sp.]|uniref:sigma-54-dependent transcriptional regulator n=1 Tax=Sphingorhabdus sp. TaxID=1902408 RepID=UPI00273D8B43|nr:sigma-54 dependent transcriptional regulator [Sphingorhabdus sp.]MDP4873635.1 sigma-54 dependent transcriptional regulator [Sphingorhabdus sp.]